MIGTPFIFVYNGHAALFHAVLVGRVGLEPTLPYGPDLQSGEVPTTLYRPIYLPTKVGSLINLLD